MLHLQHWLANLSLLTMLQQRIGNGKSASVQECLRSTDLYGPCSCPQRPPQERVPKQSLRFTLMQENQAC
jgi:hypothetical protein